LLHFSPPHTTKHRRAVLSELRPDGVLS